MAVTLLSAQYTRIHVANWPNHFTPGYHSMAGTSLLASRNIAYMCKCYVISSCGTISPEMVKALATNEEVRAYLLDPKEGGGSVILDPRAEIIAGPMEGDQEGIICADADLRETERNLVCKRSSFTSGCIYFMDKQIIRNLRTKRGNWVG
jgi:aliphatic nitrilase